MIHKKGFTLIELLIALCIVLPVLLGAIGLNVYIFRLAETSRHSTIAIQDAHAVIEQLRNTSKTSLAQVVANYPSGQAVAGFNNLPSEQVIVTYPNANADPLAITVTVTWSDRQGNLSRALNTWVTRR